MPVSSNLDFALDYARRGLAVFPCQPKGKTPLTSHGFLDASKDENQIRQWWQQHPDANIGIATGKVSNLVVVDVDENKGGELTELLNVEDVYQSDLNTTKVQTGGGLHLYYKYPSKGEVRNSASKLAKFVDVRGDGGYVIAPPSIHPNGEKYKLVSSVPDFPEFPESLLKKLNAPPALNHSSGLVVPVNPGLKVPEKINEGTRNESLAKIAGSLRRVGLTDDEIEAALLKVNHRVCRPALESEEVRRIARSISRYETNELGTVSPEDDKDYENTLQPYLLGEFLEQTFEEKEILGFHIGKRDIAIIQAATNAGKTTLLRNVSLCMAVGRPFAPFYEGGRPIRIAYFDFENDAPDVQRDFRQMVSTFTQTERDLLKKNFVIIPKGLMNGELFQFNTHETWANNLIHSNKIEFILVDNISAAYDLNDENSNAEVTKKVIKPLLKMAYKSDCAFLFAHHYGKSKAEMETAGVHAGRGASALQSLSRTVINMFGDVSKGEPITVECAKRKTDGGQNYRVVFKLKEDRWFHHTMIVPAPKKKTAYQTIREYFDDVVFPHMVSTAEVIKEFEDQFGADMIKKALNELYKDGFISRPQHGQYCGKELDENGKV